MNQTHQNFMPKNAGPTVHVKGRESKLPPKAQQSPASNFKGKAIKNKQFGTPASKISNTINATVCKDNIYYPKREEQVDVLYKKGARSISQRREVTSANTKLNQTQANTSTQNLTQNDITQSKSLLLNSS